MSEFQSDASGRPDDAGRPRLLQGGVRSATPLVLLITSCATTSPMSTAHAPTPFTAAQIRAATSEGRTYTFEVTSDGKTMYRKLTFHDVSDAGASFDAVNLDAQRTPLGPPQSQPVTWDELESHARYPAAHTRIEVASVEVPAGRFDCKLYVVEEQTEAGPKQTRAWFAKALPGAPVRHEVRVAGEITSTMVLVAHEAGR